MKRIAVVIAVAVAAAALGLAVAAGPKPSEVPVTWELGIDIYDVVKPILVTLPGADEPSVFWYLRYLVSNETGEDREFTPVIDLATNTGYVYRIGTDTPPQVFQRIKGLHNQPLLLDLHAMAGRILQGEDNAKDGVAIWPDFDSQAGVIEIFISGLSGETQTIHLPYPVDQVTVDPDGNESMQQVTEVTLRKTLKLTYALAGEAEARLTTPAKLIGKQWIMR